MAFSNHKVQELLRACPDRPEAICLRAGISNSYLNGIRYGDRMNPTADVLARLAQALGCRVGDFFDDDSEAA